MANDWLRYTNQGATRRLPLNDKLIKALSFLPEMGLGLEVFSGGQPDSGPNRTGSHRHDWGGAGDVFLTRDGKRLSWENSADLPLYTDFVKRAKAAGITGIGAGEGYMQPGSLHIGFGTPAVWGRKGKGENVAPWLAEAYGAPAPAAGRTVLAVSKPDMARLTSGTPVAQMQDSVKASARTPDASTFNKPVAEWFDRSQPSSPELVTETASKKKKKSEGTVSEGFKDVYDSMEDKNALLWQWVSDAMRPKTQVPVAYNVWK